MKRDIANQSVRDPMIVGDLLVLIQTIISVANPVCIVLFGSKARGDSGPNSDTDLIIVQSEQDAVHQSRWRELHRIREALKEIPLAKDLLLYRPHEFEYWRNSLNHVVGRAVREGLVVYERT